MSNYRDIIGQKFGRLLVLEEERRHPNGRYRIYVKCQCDCGTTKWIEKSKVMNGVTRSCGCLARETASKLRKKPDGVAPFNEIYGQYRKSARNRGYEFSLSKEEFRKIITQPCVYCGESLTSVKKERYDGRRADNTGFRYTGIDRYDNTKGYTLENSVPCCKKCNRIKTDMTIEEMEERLQKMLSRKDFWKRTA